MQDGALPQIAEPVMQLLKRHFGNDRIISHHFPRAGLQDHQTTILVTSGGCCDFLVTVRH